jgi:hypothetical protein
MTVCTSTQEPRNGLFASTFQVTWCRYLALMKGGPYSTDTQCAVTLGDQYAEKGVYYSEAAERGKSS